MKSHPAASPVELVILVADADLENTLSGLLRRSHAMQIRPVKHLIRRHQGRDPGCRTLGVDFLRMYCSSAAHALLVFDLQGCGRESVGAVALESEIEARLSTNGWHDRAAAIVIEPELENWVWSDSSHVDRVAGWQGRIPSLREWLVDQGLSESTTEKPRDPKDAFHRALRVANKRPSSALFRELAESVSFSRCTDRAFAKLLRTLQNWFPLSRSDISAE